MSDDVRLLREFVGAKSEAAFRALVGLRLDFVYAAALRQVGGDAHLAAEVAQNVFIDLARKAVVLQSRPTLAGWLHTSTRFAAAKALRSRIRRMNHETAAQAMDATLTTESRTEVEWSELRPLIDAALHDLGEKDRTVLLLRFFDGRSLGEVGAEIGLAENSARMRVDRALEKLRAALARRGVTSTAAALGVALAAQPAIAAPAGLAASVAGTALAGAAVAGAGVLGTATGIFTLMSTTKFVTGAVAAIAFLGLGAYLGATMQGGPRSTPIATAGGVEPTALASLREENSRLQAELARRASAAASGRASTSSGVAAAGTVRSEAIDRLRVLTDLQRRKLVTPEVNLLSEGAKVSHEFSELFGLSPAEQEALQLGIEAAREKVAALEKENTTVTRAPNGDVRIEIKPFPETGGAVYDTMLKTFADTLGPERYQAFLALGAEQAEKSLDRFGASVRDVTVGRNTQPNGEVLYRIRARASSPPRDNWNYNSDWLTAERFRHEASAFLHLLPPDFVPPK